MSRLPEHAIVRTLVGHRDDKGRDVPAGVSGTIVHSYDGSNPPACVVEVLLFDDRGNHDDAQLFDALERDLLLERVPTE